MTIPTPRYREETVSALPLATQTEKEVIASKLGDGKLDSDDIKKVTVFVTTNKKLMYALWAGVLVIAGAVGGNFDRAVEVLDENDPFKPMAAQIEVIDVRTKSIEAKLDELMGNEPDLPVGPAVAVTPNFNLGPRIETDIPFTVTPDSTTDDGSSPIKSQTTFSVQSIEIKE